MILQGWCLCSRESKIVMCDEMFIFIRYFEYILRKKEDKQDIAYGYLSQQYPKELKKKVNLLQHFKAYLEKQNKKPNLENSSRQVSIQSRDLLKIPNLIYVKKWMKTKHAIMFRLSNKVV